MNEYDVKRLGLILALRVEADGMVAENMQCVEGGIAPPHGYGAFGNMADQIREVVAKHDHQL
jgi:hypothetical protein